MSGAENIDPNQAISFAITKFPNSLIIPSDENLFSFRITNNQSDLGTLKFSIAGENLKIAIPEEFESEIKLQPSESKNYDLKIEPVVDGFGKLIINAYWRKIVKVVVKVQKLRDKVAKSKLKEIFKSYSESKTKTGDIFNAKSFIESISEKDLLIFQQQFEQKKNKYKSFQLLKQSQINQAAPPLSEPIQEISLKEIEKDLKKLAKGFLYNKNLTRALQLSLELSDESDKLEFYRNLIRAYATIDLNGTLQDVMGISDNSLKQAIITQIATDRVAIDAEQASRVAMLIEDIAVKEKLILNIVRITIEQNPALALKLSYLLEESMLKVEIMFNIAKKIHEQNNREELISIINQIITLLLNYKKNNFEENNYKNNACEGLVNAICVLAEIDSPKSAEAVIENLSSQQLKEKVALELFNILYVMVDEVKEKLEPTLLFSQYYLFNTLISNVNDAIKDFSLIGGNVSNNILLSDFNFNVILLSLFNYDFSVFPVIDRVYADLRYNYQKSIAYYIYPSIDNHKENELKIINATLKHFIVSNLTKVPGQAFVFNLDFIPYLGKPTVIISPDPDLYNYFTNKLGKLLGNTVDLIIDDDLFQGGKTVDNLKQLFPENKCKIVNLVLSYEFINNYEIFRSLMYSLI